MGQSIDRTRAEHKGLGWGNGYGSGRGAGRGGGHGFGKGRDNGKGYGSGFGYGRWRTTAERDGTSELCVTHNE